MGMSVMTRTKFSGEYEHMSSVQKYRYSYFQNIAHSVFDISDQQGDGMT